MRHNHVFNIRILFAEKSETSKAPPAQSQKPKEAQSSSIWENLGKQFSDISLSDVKEAYNELMDAEKSEIQAVRDTYKILKATGAVPDLSSIASVVNRWLEGSGATGLRSVIKALKDAKNGNISIVTYSNKQYKPYNLRQYEAEVSNNPSELNAGVVSGLIGLYNNSGNKDSHLSFSKKTWEEIAIYCAGRGWDSKIINGKSKDESFLKELYKEQKTEQEGKLNKIIDATKERIGKDNPEIRKLLENSKILGKDGNIDIDLAIAEFGIKKLDEVPKKFREQAEKLKKDADILFGLAKKELKELNLHNSKLSDIGIKDADALKKYNTKNLSDLDEKEVSAVILILQKELDSTKDPAMREKLKRIIESLVKKSEGFKKIRTSAQSNHISKKGEKGEKGGTTLDGFVKDLKKPESTKQLQIAGDMGVDRKQVELLSEDLFQKMSLEEVQRKYTELNNKKLTPEEESLKRKLYAIIQANIKQAQTYDIARKTIGRTEAQSLFTESNRYISGKVQEIYNFDALETIATIKNPESTPGELAFARMVPGKPIAMVQLIEGEMESSIIYSPEISSIHVEKNTDGSYYIRSNGNSLNIEKPLTPGQVKEYIKDIRMYADLGLSQFIPLIPTITEELQKKGYATKIDGNISTMEQQIILKALYRLLFKENIETTDVNDVKHRYHKILGNPTNMKAGFQWTLKQNGLIPENNQPIRKDVLINWIRLNKMRKEDDILMDSFNKLNP